MKIQLRSLSTALTLVFFALLANASPLSLVMELEYNLAQKIKGIVVPVDPNAIVSVNVTPKRVTTQLPVTGMDTFNFFATESRGTVESSDVESIKVSVYSSLDPFPEEIQRIVENSVKTYSKKGEVTISKVDAKTTEIFTKRLDAANRQADSLQKISMEYSEHIYQLAYILAGTFGIVILLASLLVSGLLRGSMNKISKGMTEIKIETGGGSPAMAAAAPSSSEAASRTSSGATSSGGSSARLDEMKTESLRSLFSDCYWCEKDGYAHWVWAQLSPGKKAELLQGWSTLSSYVEYFSHLEPREDRFHHDPYYLSPGLLDAVSNEDLRLAMERNQTLWGYFSSMRKESLSMSLRERLALMKVPSLLGKPLPVSFAPSVPRILPMQIDIQNLSEDDEIMLFEEPHLVSKDVARKIASWVWVALLPQEEKVKILNSLTAQAIAESWVGPKVVLDRIYEAMPEKKRSMFDEYRGKVQGRRSSQWLRIVTDVALPQLTLTPPPPIENDQFDESAA